MSRVHHRVVLWLVLRHAINRPLRFGLCRHAFPVASSKWLNWSYFFLPLFWQLVQPVCHNRGTKKTKKRNGLEHPSITSLGPFGRNLNRTTRVGKFIHWLPANSPSIHWVKRVMYWRKRLHGTETWFFLILVKNQKQAWLKLVYCPWRLKKNMHLYRWSRTNPVSNFQPKIKSSRNFYSKLSVLNVVMIADCFYLEIVLRPKCWF